MRVKKQGKVVGVLVILVAIVSLGASVVVEDFQPPKNAKPNVVIILSDDQGYGDVSYQEHPEEISTPAIDKLAAQGVVFTNAYASAYVCAPTRAGLLTGRYQQRFGFYRASDSRRGLPLSEKTLAEYLKEEGYSTGVFGKWHLGLEYAYRPLQRGFDEFYGFLGHGAHDYFDLTCNESQNHNCIYRNNEIMQDVGYLTDVLAKEACSFIERHSAAAKPFFLYLPFNAVHWPLQAPEEDIKRFDTGDSNRDIMLAMLYRMDIAVGKVQQTLHETGAYDNTLIFYFSDNGGAAKIHANNFPLRDYKQSTYEGGVRVPFIMSWPGKITPGVKDEPVISIDILPTVFSAVGKELPDDRIFDGRDIFRAINEKAENPLHDQLFWDGNDGSWAVREGDFKLVKSRKGSAELYDLGSDIGESKNIIESEAVIADRLQKDYLTWRSEMGNPMQPKRK